jgi:hypothetical protein
MYHSSHSPATGPGRSNPSNSEELQTTVLTYLFREQYTSNMLNKVSWLYFIILQLIEVGIHLKTLF